MAEPSEDNHDQARSEVLFYFNVQTIKSGYRRDESTTDNILPARSLAF